MAEQVVRLLPGKLLSSMEEEQKTDMLEHLLYARL
jgi:hypothetical protein